MNVHWGWFAAASGAALALFALLWLLNVPRERRPEQGWVGVAVLVFAVVTLYVVGVHPDQVASVLAAILREANSRWHLAIPVDRGSELVLLNLMLPLVFLLLKAAGTLVARFGHRRGLVARRSAEGPVPVPLRGLGRVAYGYEPGRGVRLRHAWWFPRRLLFGTALCALAILLTAIAAGFAGHVVLPATLPALAALVFLEWAWFLGGPEPWAGVGSLQGTDAAGRLLGQYESLWRRYQSLWPERHLASTYELGRPAAVIADPAEFAVVSSDDEAALLIADDIRATGVRLDEFQVNLLRDFVTSADVLVQNAHRESLDPALFGYLQHRLARGDRLLVLGPSLAACAPLAAWVRDGLARFVDVDPERDVMTLSGFLGQQAEPKVLVVDLDSAMQQLDKLRPWMRSLRLVVVPRISELLRQLQTWEGLVAILEDLVGRSVQHILLSEDRGRLEPALNRSLPLRTREHRPPVEPCSRELAAIVWRLEGQEWPQQALMAGHVAKYLGSETVLAVPAWEEDIRSIRIAGVDDLPWREWLEELQGHRAQLLPGVVDSQRLLDTAARRLEIVSPGWLATQRERGCILVRDHAANLVTIIREWRGRATGALLLHVVSAPYLLRDYLADNLDYFERTPLLPLTPRLSDDTQRLAIDLVQRMSRCWQDEAALLDQLARVDPGVRSVEEGLPRLLERVLREMRTLEHLERSLDFEFDEEAGDFVRRVRYRLSAELAHRLRWMDVVDHCDAGQRVLGRIRRDHLFQCALPGQVLGFDGKSYVVSGLDERSSRMRLDLVTPGARRDLGEPHYRPRRIVDLIQLPASRTAADRELRSHDGVVVEREWIEAHYRIRTPGYYSFEGGVNLGPHKWYYRELEEGAVPARDYPLGRLLRVRIRTPRTELHLPGVARTLALLLQEALVTLLPETHRFLIVLPPALDDSHRDTPFDHLLPQTGFCDGVPDPEQRAWLDSVVLYFLEDSHADMGLAQCVRDEWDYLVQIVADYLAWFGEQDDRSAERKWTTNAIRATDYLSFGLDRPPEALDIAGTVELLTSLGAYENRNSIGARRRAWKERGHQVPEAPDDGDRRRCDFCATKLPSAEFERLSDGRERCSRCRASAVDTLQQAEDALRRARAFLAPLLPVPLRRNVTIQLVNATDLHAAIARAFLPTASYDVRAIGVAIRSGEDSQVLVENGQPYHLALSTLVHELTHVWQHDYLDTDAMQRLAGLRLIEGHAQWASIECLRQLNLAPDFCASEAARSDVYGEGYREVVRMLQASGGTNAFAMLLGMHGRRDVG